MISSELVLPGYVEPSFERLAEVFVAEYTRPGDLVLDPFAGSGTTMAVARRLGRQGLGVEIVPELVAGIRERLGSDAVVEADARELAALDLPRPALVLTSPPFMTKTDHPQNPLSGYQTLDGDYQAYLPEVARITGTLLDLVQPGGRVVLDLWNFHAWGQFTPLASDVESALDGVGTLERRVRLRWPDWNDVDDDLCLVYTKRGAG